MNEFNDQTRYVEELRKQHGTKTQLLSTLPPPPPILIDLNESKYSVCATAAFTFSRSPPNAVVSTSENADLRVCGRNPWPLRDATFLARARKLYDELQR